MGLNLPPRLSALLLGLLLLALALIGVTLGLRIHDFAQAQAERSAYGQLALIVQSAETSTASETTSGQDYEYQVFHTLSECHSVHCAGSIRAERAGREAGSGNWRTTGRGSWSYGNGRRGV